MKNAIARVWLAASILFAAAYTHAEDIDLFSGILPGGANIPTVLLGWHSSGNSNANASHGCVYSDTGGAPELGDTVGGMEQCAIVNTLLSLLEPANAGLLGNIKVGMMVFNENAFSSFNNGSGLGNGDNTCGFLLVPPTIMDADGIASFIGLLKSFDNNMLANQSRLGDLIAESWAMLNGLPSSCSGVDYSSMASIATDCRDAVLVYIGNATKETANVSDGTGDPDVLLKSQLTSNFSYSTGSDEYKYFATPRSVTLLNNSGADNNDYWGDEWTRFMNRVDVDDSTQSDRNVTTYSIAVYDPDLESKLAGEINFLSDMATEGGGKAFKVTAENHAGLADILLQIFNEVQDVNSVFSSATLPVSANTQGTFLNQVYIAMFRPDSTASPRWTGNVKQYQLGFDSGGNIVLTDATQDPANAVTSVTNPITGALAGTAQSFWTTNTPKEVDNTAVADWPLDGFWKNSPEGDAFMLDAPDGDLVEKGGAGQMLRIDNLTSSAARVVYTCNSSGACPTGTSLPAFNTANSTLVTNLDAIVGAGASGGTASISVGRRDTNETISITSCSGRGNSVTCVITHDGSGGTNLVASTDRVVIEGAWNNTNYLSSNKWTCTYASPCAITDVTNTTFTIAGKDIESLVGQSFSNTVIVEVSKAALVSQTSHGLSIGDPVELANCTISDTSDTYNASILQGNVLGSVAGIPNGDQYILTLGDYVLAETAGISCSSSAVTLSASNLINWMRGDDIVGNEVKRGPCPPELRDTDSTSADYCPISVRGSIHGDVLHSRPAVINYGGSTGVVVFYGSNDGHFRAINGNQTAAIGSVRAGGELWSFVAPEFFDKLARQYKASPVVKYPAVVDPSAQERDYFFDGTTTVLQDNRTGTSTAGKAYLFMSARRGGRLIYAFDVTTPTAPKFLWRVTEADIPELGQTWSQPKVTIISGHDNPVVIFGAGYDEAEDTEPAPTSDTMGRGIIMLDAVSGDVLWAAVPNCTGMTLATDGSGTIGHCLATSALTRAIPADITIIDRDSDSYTDRLYAADVGGNIWRVDLEADGIGTTDFSEVTLTKLASLGGTGNNARKFLFGPDVVPTNNYDAVVAVSGDREHPLYTADTTPGLAYNVQDSFYMIMDKNIGKSVAAGFTTIQRSDLVDQTTAQCVDSSGAPLSCDDANAESPIYFNGTGATVKGYFIDLVAGEKGVNAPLAVAGKVYFGTNQPDVPAEGSCTANLGNAGAWVVSLVNGTYQRNIFSGGGLPPSPIAGLVTINGNTVPFIIGGAGPSPFDPSLPDLDLSAGRKRSFWYFK